MKKTTIAILIAVLVVAIGAGLCFVGLSAVNFKFEKLDRTEYTTNTYTFTDPIQSIELEVNTADVELLAAENESCKVVCFENKRENYAVSTESGRLVIRPVSSGSGWIPFGFSFKSPKISVYLPAGEYAQLKASLNTGDITADKALSFIELNVELHTGDLTLNGVQAQRVTASASTGDIRLSDMTPETADIRVRTGKIELSNLVCTGDLTCESTTGDIRLTDVDGANLYLTASTGDITGTIRTEKVFSAHASTGDVRVPSSTAGGRCEAQTSTGDIRLSINGQ